MWGGTTNIEKEYIMNYSLVNGIPDFRTVDGYWCNVSRSKMREVNTSARERGWLTAIDELIPEYRSAIVPYARADVQYLLPLKKESIVLDAGSMWGGLTIPIAQNCGQIYAADKTLETLEFLNVRAEQMGFSNIHTIATDLDKLPFDNRFFDIVMLNGVLEWIPVLQDINLETYWKGKLTDTTRYSASPRQMQLAVLKEIRRVLKPTGTLCLAIENKFGAQYLMGYPDDHVNIKYVSLLPRFLANIITKRIRGCEYRAYTYSLAGYQKLLRESGFSGAQFHGAFLHYIDPETIVPINMLSKWKLKVLPDQPIVKAFPSAWLKYVAPSYIAITGDNEPLLSRMLQAVGVLHSLPAAIVKCKSRPRNYNTANFIVYAYDKNIPTYFCKVCRDNKHTDILIDEAHNLKAAHHLLNGQSIERDIPELVFFGVLEGITLLVQRYIEGKPTKFDCTAKLTKTNLQNLDNDIRTAIRFLVRFQKGTSHEQISTQQLISIIKEYRAKLNSSGLLTDDNNKHIEDMFMALQTQAGVLPLCAVHGDFDFWTNILFGNHGVSVIDFEGFQPVGLPFFDLTTLIYHAIIISYSKSVEYGVSLSVFIDHFSGYIHQWAKFYSDLSDISLDIVQHFSRIAVLEQMTKVYPYYRDPTSYPLRNPQVLSELLSRQDIHA